MLASLSRSATSAVAHLYGDNFVENARRELVAEPLDDGWVITEETQHTVKIADFGDMFAAATVNAHAPAAEAAAGPAPEPVSDSTLVPEFTNEELAAANMNISGYYDGKKWAQLETAREYCLRMRENDKLAAARAAK